MMRPMLEDDCTVRPDPGWCTAVVRGLRFTIPLGLLALAMVPSRGAAVVPGVEAPIRYELPNGLSVVLDPLPARQSVAVVVSVEAGRRDQPPGWTGLAHLTEHLLFQGTPAAPGELMTRLERLGATAINAQTGDDWTRYYEVVPSARLERALWIEAERFAHGLDALDDQGLAEQRRVLDREREQRDLGREAVWELVRTILYPPSHPYGSARERAGDVHAARVADVRWFFQRHYMPDRMTLSLSGGFDPDRARVWIERYFGPLRRGPISAPPRQLPPPSVRIDGERRVLAEARRSDDLLCVIWPTPPWGAPGDAELDFVAGELTRRLARWRRVSRVVRDIDISQESGHLASTFRACVSVERRSGTQAPLMVLDGELEAMRRAPIEEEAIAAWRRRWMDGELVTMEHSLRRAQRNAARPPAFPGGVYDLGANLARYDAVTNEGVQRAVRRWLPSRDRLVVSVAGRHEAPPEGRIVSDVFVVEAP